ncbi:MAG: cytochrome c biogenesis protein CcsA [Nitrososphaerales archaeon]
MLWENATIYLAIALYLLGLGLLLARRVRPARYVLSVSLLPVLVLLAVYVYAFLSDDFSFDAVYQSSSSGMPILYKLSASWTSAGGSLLLLVVMMGAGLLAHEVLSLRRRDDARTTSLIVSFLIFYFLVAVVMVDPFGQLSPVPANGLGLTPSLQSYWALIHPPSVFAAYVAVLFAYCSVLTARLSKSGPRLGDARLLTGSWILLGLGIALGGAWAYQTLGWGGYWSWDPIETSALIPWLALSAVLFARRRANLNAELFGLTFATSALLLISYVARGSAVVSLHSYGDLATGIPFILLCLFPVFFSVATLLRSRASGSSSAAPSVALPKGDFYLLEFWCLILLALANTVLLLLEVFAGDFGVMFAPNPLIHNYVSFPFVLAFATLLTVESASRRPSLKHAVVLAPVLLVAGAALWFSGAVTASPYLAVGLPFLLALAVGGVLGVAGTLATGGRRGGGRGAGMPWGSTVRYLTVLGIALMLLGVFVSDSSRTTVSRDLAVGESVTVGGTTLTVLGISISPGQGTVDMPGHGIVSQTIDTRVTYSISGQQGTSETTLEYFPVLDEFFALPSVLSSWNQDVYVVANATVSVDQATSRVFQNGTSAAPTDVGISVQTIPGIGLVWIGAALLLAFNLFFVVRRSPYSTSASVAAGDGPPAPPSQASQAR